MDGAKVGDVVAWADVQDGALVRRRHAVFLKLNGAGHIVGGSCQWRSWHELDNELPAWSWAGTDFVDPVTIIAMGLTGEETAADLQRLAETFEVREALRGYLDCLSCRDFACSIIAKMWSDASDKEAFYAWAHSAGVRPGMSVTDAARLLQEAGAK